MDLKWDDPPSRGVDRIHNSSTCSGTFKMEESSPRDRPCCWRINQKSSYPKVELYIFIVEKLLFNTKPTDSAFGATSSFIKKTPCLGDFRALQARFCKTLDHQELETKTFLRDPTGIFFFVDFPGFTGKSWPCFRCRIETKTRKMPVLNAGSEALENV